MILAVAILVVCYVSRTNSVDVTSLNLNTLTGLFDPRPEELDKDLLSAPKSNAEDAKENQNLLEEAKLGKSKSPEKANTGETSKVSGDKGKAAGKKTENKDALKVGDPKNPNGYLGDISEVDPLEEMPHTNADDKDMEKDRALRIKQALQQDVDDEFNDFTEFVPATVPEVPYPVVPPLDKTLMSSTLDFRIYTHNVKNGKHGELVPGEFDWDERKNDVVASILLHKAPNTIIVLQEALDFQLAFIMERLNLLIEDSKSHWIALGGGRIDGKSEGEHVPIIVRKNEWEVVYQDTFWLNDKKTRTAVAGWDAKYPRICTYATLKNKGTGAYINVFNTHFDHKGKSAKTESAKLLMAKMETVNEWPSILTGDLNSKPGDKCYEALSKSLIDSRKLTTAYNRYGHREFTVTGFQGAQGQKGLRIDYVFVPSITSSVTKKECPSSSVPVFLQLQGYGLLHSKFGGMYMSDHRPVLVDLRFGKC